MRFYRLLRALTLPALATLGCGDALVESGYQGEPLFTFVGQIGAVSAQKSYEKPVRAAVFWHPEGEVDPSEAGDELVEQDAISVATRFPGHFELNVFQPPPDIRWRDSKKPYRVGLVLLYEDLNEDGRFQEGELIGGARNLVLLYAIEDIPAAESDTGEAWAKGYRVEQLPMPCGHPPPSFPTVCRTPLGKGCSDDDHCGSGRCVLRDHERTWPGGMCVLDADDCDEIRHTPVRIEEEEDGWVSLFTQRCVQSSDCRFTEGYECEDGWCLPGEPTALVLDPQFERTPLCAAEVDDDDDDDDSRSDEG